MRLRHYKLDYMGFKEFRERNYFDVEEGTVRAKRGSTRRYNNDGKIRSSSESYVSYRVRRGMNRSLD